MSYTEYIQSYKEGLDFQPTDSVSYELCGISIKIDTYEYSDATSYHDMVHITLESYGKKYEFDCIEAQSYQKMFHPVSISGESFLLFRRTLYGFSLINTESFEIYDYFPEKVCNGEESFIVCEAKSFGNLIIFDGCYWAFPYSFYAYDHQNRLFLDLSKEYMVQAEDKMEIQGDTLILNGSDKNEKKITVSIEYDELCKRMSQKGLHDFDEPFVVSQ